MVGIGNLFLGLVAVPLGIARDLEGLEAAVGGHPHEQAAVARAERLLVPESPLGRCVRVLRFEVGLGVVADVVGQVQVDEGRSLQLVRANRPDPLHQLLYRLALAQHSQMPLQLPKYLRY